MKTDVWMPLYWGDLLSDTLHLGRADFGSYMLLIGAYWRKQGPLPDDDAYLSNVARVTLSEWSATRSALAQHFQIEGGAWHHKRVDHEIQEAQRRSEARKRGAEATNHAKRIAKRTLSDPLSVSGSVSLSGVHSHSHIAVEKELFSIEAARPAWEEVWAYSQVIGLSEWKARDWLDEMCAAGWKDWNHRDVVDWRAMLRRVKTKWEADGRPSTPPVTQQKGQNGHTKNSSGGNRNSGTTNDGKATGYSAAAARVIAARAIPTPEQPAEAANAG